MIDEIKYQWYCFKLWKRETWLKFKGIDRNFYCQSGEEFEGQCYSQCDHCEEYYRPLQECKNNN